MKLLGSLLLIASGLLWGCAKSRELLRRERLLTEWQRLMQSFKTGISYSARPLAEMIRGDTSPFCREAVKLPDFSRDPRQALAQAGENLLGRQTDKALYQSFAAGLGASDASGQLRHIDLYAAMVEQALKEAREERDRRGRLYICLGLFGGLTVCLLLL